MTSHEIIDKLLNAKEGEHYQFKEWKMKDDLREAAKICGALANCGGGKLVLGVTDKRPREIVGSAAFPQPERTRIDLMNKLHVQIDFNIYYHENKRVIVFDVAGRPIGLPVQTDGVVWWYHGDSLIPMPEEIRREIYSELNHDFSNDICTGAGIDDLDAGAIDMFRRAWGDYIGNTRIFTLSDEQLLRDCGALIDNNVTYAALILFGKRSSLLKYRLTQAEIIFEYRSSESAGPAAQRVEFLEGFFNIYDRIWELVDLRNDKQHYQEGFHVFPVPTFNERVVREAILNAVSHRDYRLAGSIFVRQYSRRIVFESPGGLPSGITIANILDKQSPRNDLIARIFQYCGLVERSGQGMNLIFESSIKEAKPLPDFTGSDPFFVKLTLNCQLVEPRLLTLLKKIGDEKLRKMTTDDYILLCEFYRNGFIHYERRQKLNNLIKLGIIIQTENGHELVNGDLASMIVKNYFAQGDGNMVRERASDYLVTVDEPAVKERNRKIISFIEVNKGATSSILADYTGLSQSRIRKILNELAAEGLIEKNGNYRYASYTIK